NVTWSSSGDGIYNLNPHVAGDVQILAYTVGEESFTDVDGDGIFDNSDLFTVNTGTGDSFVERLGDPSTNDIGEVYLDGDESGAHQSGEFFHDFNNDGVRNPPDGHFYGFGCKGTPTVPCGSTSTKEIGKQICLNASTSGAAIGFSAGGTGVLAGNTLNVGAGPTTLTFTVSDRNGHALASGASVNILQAGVTNVTATNPINIPFAYPDVGCGGNVQTFTVSIVLLPPAVPAVKTAGTIQLQVVTPGAGGAQTNSPVITLAP
ncbi:MAG: hypothetical protein ACHQAZ_05770, partial [Gammaproteobacteria bacterium]